MNLIKLHDYFKDSSGVVIDSRKVIQDCFFIGLRGENFDGNEFAEVALEKGAKYALVDRPEIANKNKRLILVDNTLKSLQELAQYHRKKLETKKKRKLASKILPNLIDLIWEPSKTTEIKPM